VNGNFITSIIVVLIIKSEEKETIVLKGKAKQLEMDEECAYVVEGSANDTNCE